jgi:hypothetical protein
MRRAISAPPGPELVTRRLSVRTVSWLVGVFGAVVVIFVARLFLSRGTARTA